MLTKLNLGGIGSVRNLDIEFGDRLNILTGDNVTMGVIKSESFSKKPYK